MLLDTEGKYNYAVSTISRVEIPWMEREAPGNGMVCLVIMVDFKFKSAIFIFIFLLVLCQSRPKFFVGCAHQDLLKEKGG